MSNFSPREIVSELDRYIIGQQDAKRAVAIALRNRWRRQQLEGELREEVQPKNILMIGPTGCGKTEISRRLARSCRRAVPQGRGDEIHRGRLRRPRRRQHRARPGRGRDRARARRQAPRRQGDGREECRGTCARCPRRRERAARDARIVPQAPAHQRAQRQGDRGPACRHRTGFPSFDVPGGQVGMVNIGDMLGKAFGQRTRTRRMTVGQSYEQLIAQESDKLLDSDQIALEAVKLVENNGIVFLDEIDKICSRSDGGTRWRRRQPRGRAARSPATHRGYDRCDQARSGQDRPRPLYRVRRLPSRQAVGLAARAAGTPADPRRTETADAVPTSAAS